MHFIRLFSQQIRIVNSKDQNFVFVRNKFLLMPIREAKNDQDFISLIGGFVLLMGRLKRGKTF